MARILVADDSRADRKFVGEILQGLDNPDLTFVENGEDAIAEIERTLPDLVVTDLFMPKMDGLALVSRIQREFPLVPVVLITSRGNEELAVQALQKGAASYVPKRLVDRYLVETVERLLDAAKEQRCRATLLGTMQSESCEFSLSNDAGLVQTLVGYILESMSHIGVGDKVVRMRIGVALEEALVNAVHHGNLEVSSGLRDEDHSAYDRLIQQRRTQAPYRDRRVQVQVRMSKTEVAFVVRDEGPGFDVTSLPDPTEPENLEKAAGRGVMLMRTFMDEVNYNDAGTMVTMIKRGQSDAAVESLVSDAS